MASDVPHRYATRSWPKALGNRFYGSLSTRLGISSTSPHRARTRNHAPQVHLSRSPDRGASTQVKARGGFQGVSLEAGGLGGRRVLAQARTPHSAPSAPAPPAPAPPAPAPPSSLPVRHTGHRQEVMPVRMMKPSQSKSCVTLRHQHSGGPSQLKLRPQFGQFMAGRSAARSWLALRPGSSAPGRARQYSPNTPRFDQPIRCPGMPAGIGGK